MYTVYIRNNSRETPTKQISGAGEHSKMSTVFAFFSHACNERNRVYLSIISELRMLIESGESFKVSKIDVHEWHSGQKVAIFTVCTSNQSHKLANLTLNLSEFWYTPKTASDPIGLLMINIILIPFKHKSTYAQTVEILFEPDQQSSSNGRCNEGEEVSLFCDIARVCYF